jgi:hypothetical protein
VKVMMPPPSITVAVYVITEVNATEPLVSHEVKRQWLVGWSEVYV